MVKDKGYIILDPVKDGEYFKTLLHIFNDLQEKQCVIFPFKEKKEKWRITSSIIGRRAIAKNLIDFKEPMNGLFFPPSSSRTSSIGFITRPKNVSVELVPYRKQKVKVVFNRKIF